MTKKKQPTDETPTDFVDDEPADAEVDDAPLTDEVIQARAEANLAKTNAPPAAAEPFAALMGIPPREILTVVAHEDGHIVTTFDGVQCLVGPDGAVARWIEAVADDADADGAEAERVAE